MRLTCLLSGSRGADRRMTCTSWPRGDTRRLKQPEDGTRCRRFAENGDDTSRSTTQRSGSGNKTTPGSDQVKQNTAECRQGGIVKASIVAGPGLVTTKHQRLSIGGGRWHICQNPDHYIFPKLMKPSTIHTLFWRKRNDSAQVSVSGRFHDTPAMPAGRCRSSVCLGTPRGRFTPACPEVSAPGVRPSGRPGLFLRRHTTSSIPGVARLAAG